MKKLMILAACGLAAGLFAEEFGAAKELSSSQEALKKDASAQDATPVTGTRSPVRQALVAVAKKAGFTVEQWDEKNQQFVVIEVDTFTHSTSELDDNYLMLRSATMMKLMLRAKSAIIEALAGEITASRVRDVDPQIGEDIALLKNEVSRVARLKLLGCTILNQAENAKKLPSGEYEIEMGILYSWSKDGEALALNMISPNEKPLLAKKRDGAKPVRDWLEEKASIGSLVRWHGPRRYVDDEGNAWFLGIETAPRSVNSRKNDRLRGIATTRADGDIALSVFSDAWMEATATELVKQYDIKGEQELSDDQLTQCERAYVEKMGEKINKLRLPGRSKLFEDVLEFKGKDAVAGSGKDVYVVVRGVSAKQASQSRAIWSKAVEAAEIAEKRRFEEYKPAKPGISSPAARPNSVAPTTPKPTIPTGTFVD